MKKFIAFLKNWWEHDYWRKEIVRDFKRLFK